MHKLDRYPFRKMRKSQEQYPYKNEILHNFHLIFFFCDGYFKVLQIGGFNSFTIMHITEKPMAQFS